MTLKKRMLNSVAKALVMSAGWLFGWYVRLPLALHSHLVNPILVL